jgi:predicted RNase H-like HicB family nuclease/transcriptional regulator with XRE-family HTH domain
MGKRARQKPERLAEKLVKIRTALGLSQNAMIRHLGFEENVTQNILTNYELGSREPTLLMLLAYARAAGVHMEALVDDNLDLPDKLPANVSHESIKRQYASRSRAKKRWSSIQLLAYEFGACHHYSRRFNMKFNVTIDQDEDGVWIVECPSIPGCVSQGETREEALENVKEAIALCLEVRAEKGLPLTIETTEIEVAA